MLQWCSNIPWLVLKLELQRNCWMQSPGQYIHTAIGYALNSTFEIRSPKLMKGALDTTHEIVKLLKWSPRRDICLARLKADLAPDTPGIRIFCHTRWTVWAEKLHSIIDNNYE